MSFVVDFFRSRQQDGKLFDRPFAAAQAEVILAGGMPSGSLSL